MISGTEVVEGFGDRRLVGGNEQERGIARVEVELGDDEGE